MFGDNRAGVARRVNTHTVAIAEIVLNGLKIWHDHVFDLILIHVHIHREIDDSGRHAESLRSLDGFLRMTFTCFRGEMREFGGVFLKDREVLESMLDDAFKLTRPNRLEIIRRIQALLPRFCQVATHDLISIRFELFGEFVGDLKSRIARLGRAIRVTARSQQAHPCVGIHALAHRRPPHPHRRFRRPVQILAGLPRETRRRSRTTHPQEPLTHLRQSRYRSSTASYHPSTARSNICSILYDSIHPLQQLSHCTWVLAPIPLQHFYGKYLPTHVAFAGIVDWPHQIVEIGAVWVSTSEVFQS